MTPCDGPPALPPPRDVALPPLRDVIRRHRLDARKKLGQHFLLDGNLTDRIARASGPLAETSVIEVGAGPGGLTRSLLAAGARHVIAIEKDPRCVQALMELATAFPDRLTVIEDDALALDARTLAPAPRRVVANLPYNIATPLLLRWTDQIADFSGLTLMVQREVADRLAAPAGSTHYGRLSVIVQWRCHVQFEFSVSARAFVPPPKVVSAVVTITPRAEPVAPADRAALERVTAAAFGQRRKMLRGSLKSLGLDAEVAGIDGTRRAGELSVEEFCALARLLHDTARPGPDPDRQR